LLARELRTYAAIDHYLNKCAALAAPETPALYSPPQALASLSLRTKLCRSGTEALLRTLRDFVPA